MKKVSCIIHIRNGEIMNKSAVKNMFDALTDGRYVATVENKNKRSLPQNAYLHAVLIPEFRKALNSVGYSEVRTEDQAKLIMKSMFLRETVTNEQTGEVIEFIKDTHNLTREEMGVLIEEVIRFAAENMGYVIPYPGEQLTAFA